MFSLQKYGGITKYFCELMKNLPSEHEFELSVLISENQHLKDNFKVFQKMIRLGCQIMISGAKEELKTSCII